MISNELDLTPSISYQEEDVVTVGEQQFKTQIMSSVWASFDPTAEIPLVDPDTGLATGETRTHKDFYVLLHSLYIQQANARDDAATAAALATQQAAQLAADKAAAAAQIAADNAADLAAAAADAAAVAAA